MATDPKRALHQAIDRLSVEEARRLSAELGRAIVTHAERRPRLLTEADIILSEPVLPDDESADALISAVRHWRREGGHA